MAEEVIEKKLMSDVGFTVSEDGFDDNPYEVLPDEEPIKVNISAEPEVVPGMWEDEHGNKKEQVKFMLKVAEGEKGAGQVYPHWINKPSINADGKAVLHPKSGLYKLLDKIYAGDIPAKATMKDLVGLPLRIELKKPNDKGYQYVALVKSPTADQKTIHQDTALTADDVAEMLGGEVVEDDS